MKHIAVTAIVHRMETRRQTILDLVYAGTRPKNIPKVHRNTVNNVWWNNTIRANSKCHSKSKTEFRLTHGAP